MIRHLAAASILSLCTSTTLGAESLFTIGEKALTPRHPAEVALAFPDDAIEEHHISVFPEAIAANPESIEFDLPDGRLFVAQRMHFADYGENWKSWAGVALGATEMTIDAPAAGWVQFHYHGDEVTGILNLDGEQYAIDTSIGGGHRLIRKRSLGKACALEHDELAADDPGGLHGKMPVGLDFGHPLEGAEGALPNKMTSTLDVLALYPSGLDIFTVAKIQNYVQGGIATANNIFQQSSIPATYNLVGQVSIAGVPNTPTTRWQEWLAWMRDISTVGTLRLSYQADIVVLVVPFNWGQSGMTWCGAANLPQKFGSQIVDRTDRQAWNKRAFSVLRSGCGANDLTLAHEIGHNYGMRHRRNENTSASRHIFPNGRGIDDFLMPGFGMRATVMGCINNGLGNGGNFQSAICDRWPIFSDPNGLAGDATHNNADAGRQQVVVYANYF